MMQTMLEAKKHKLRQDMLHKRKSLCKEQILLASEKISNELMHTKEWIEAGDICLYFPIQNEIDVMQLTKDDWQEKSDTASPKRFWLPKVLSAKPPYMEFLPYTEDCNLVEGAYHIMEPDTDDEYLHPKEDTLLVLPGSVFGRDGGRIGYGGGFYDCYMNRYPYCKTIAVCYEFQLLASLPLQEHDRRVHRIIACDLGGEILSLYTATKE